MPDRGEARIELDDGTIGNVLITHTASALGGPRIVAVVEGSGPAPF